MTHETWVHRIRDTQECNDLIHTSLKVPITFWYRSVMFKNGIALSESLNASTMQHASPLYPASILLYCSGPGIEIYRVEPLRFLLQLNEHVSLPRKGNRCGQACNLVIVLADNVGQDGVLSGRDLLRQRDILRQRHLALLQRTFEVDVANSVAEICRLSDDGNEAVLDLKVHLCAVLHLSLIHI